MRALFALIGTCALGGFGWWLGALWALPAAVVLGAVGSGVGLYWGRRLFDEWLG
jgi:hypothetical protein